MHYHSFKRQWLRVSVMSLLLLGSINLKAQNIPLQPVPVQPSQGTQLPTTTSQPASSQQAVEFYNKAKAAGMTDMDIERAAMQRGYTLDDISAMRKRLQQGGNQQSSQDVNRGDVDDTRSPEDGNPDENENGKRDTTMTRNGQTARLSRTFGSAFFREFGSSFEPNLRLATPKNYILGPEDEIVVDIYGNSVDNFKMKVSPEGTVKMLNLAPVQVSGLTVEQARERIVNRLRQAYSSLDRPGGGTYSTVTLGNIRSIRVMITGEVVRPGTYTVSSLATAFNALYQSGGPSSSGSYRNIEIIRNNNIIRRIDLYRFLVDADLKDNIALQDQDIILVRPYEKRVELNGEIKRPGVFEAKGKETISDLIRYAGGFRPEAYTAKINFQRNTGTNYVIGTLDSTNIASFVPQNGDIYRVDRILEVIANQVEVVGAVTRPGVYALEDQCNSVLELIQQAQGISPRAFMNRATIERSSGTKFSGMIAFDLNKVIQKEVDDIPLMPGDVLTIRSVDDLKEVSYVSVNGSVNDPGEQAYYQDLTIADVIFKAGGYKEEGIAYRIEVSRRVKTDTTGIPDSQNVRIFTLNIDDNLKLNAEDQKFKLQPYDIVSIRKSPRYELQKRATILGEVNYPGTYTILNNFEKISDLFSKAGGLKKEAYVTSARFYRNGLPIAIDLDEVVQKPSSAANLLLKNGDTLLIPTKSQIVRIQGGVQNPSLVNFDPSFSFQDYISQAGGYSELAWKNRIYLTHANGRTFRTKKFLFFRSYPKVEPGSSLTIPEKVRKEERQMTPGERIAVFSLLSTLAIAVISLFR